VPTGGDIIVGFDGREITSSAELQGAVESKRPGDTVTLTILRDGDRSDVEVTLDERPETP
jgi:serine protease Do